ncbi:MAG: diaminopimelate decarboxylase [Ruminococcus sp.]|jgi:diaminopimelate decarboxylase|nr:diaminopimelate decarboxylase [Ruminococcus sp.]
MANSKKNKANGLLTHNLTVKNGRLHINNVDTIRLAEEYGTPIYVMDRSLVAENLNKYKLAFEKYYQGDSKVCYASKSFMTDIMINIVNDENCCLDVSSGGEISMALMSDFPAERMFFHGNNKSISELGLAVVHNVGYIMVDNLTELENLNKIAASSNKIVNVIPRIKPGIEVDTHSYIQTGHIDSKFGEPFSIDYIKKILSFKNLKLVGLHCHIGSLIHGTEPFAEDVRVMTKYMKVIKDELSYDLTYLCLGGGFGIRYLESDEYTEYEEYIRVICEEVKSKCMEYDLALPTITIEPGRSISGPAGITLYTVGAIKEIPQTGTKYVLIDGGMADNPRYALYKSKYTAVVANKVDKPKDDVITLAGKTCESGDLLGENMPIQKCEVGDIVAVLATGAYNHSMSSNYNMLPKPEVIYI